MTNSKKVLIAALALASVVTPTGEAQTDGERIRSFDSQITVYGNNTMEVRETIEVAAFGIKIKHGIYRDFPIRYRDPWGNRVSVGFEISGLQRDGHPEPFRTTGITKGVRVWFGDSAHELPAGIHTYVFTYTTSRPLSFLEDHDELYWNVTGPGWDFPIDAAAATVVLPPQVRASHVALHGFTGRRGERGDDFTASLDSQGNAVFRSENLPPKNNLSIVVNWPKGLVAQPTGAQRVQWFMADNKAALAGLGGLAAVLLYYFLAWMAVGRDPKPEVITPMYEPPDGASPAAIRYLRRMRFDHRTFTAAILNLAAKGYLTIERSERGEYSLSRSRNYGEAESRLSPDETAMARKMFAQGETVALRRGNPTPIADSRRALKMNLRNTMEKKFFVNNHAWVIPGVALTLLTLIGLNVMDAMVGGGAALFMLAWLAAWTIAAGDILRIVIQAWRSVRAEGLLHGDARAVPFTLLAIPFVGVEAVGLYGLFLASGLVVFLIITMILATNALFHHLLKAPTKEGRRLLDRIEGFRMFLAAEHKRPDQATPEKTPHLFEKYLPYALALDVETAWAEQFSDMLAAAGQGGAGYAPAWYTGAALGAFSASGFASSFGTSFASAVASSSVSWTSSSGSGSGGFSGGGGGGGGGGGW